MPSGGRVDVHRLDAALADQRIGGGAGLLDDVVLEQAVDHDDVGAHQLLAAGHLLAERRSVVDDELQVEVGNAHAGVAFAGGRLADVATTAPEAEVAPLDRVVQQRSVELLGRGIGEGGVALELREPEIRAKGGHDGADEVGQDVLRVVELDAGEVARVARNVGDEEARGLGSGEHGRSRCPLSQADFTIRRSLMAVRIWTHSPSRPADSPRWLCACKPDLQIRATAACIGPARRRRRPDSGVNVNRSYRGEAQRIVERAMPTGHGPGANGPSARRSRRVCTIG